MQGFCKNIEELARQNTDFRHVLYTGKHTQLVLMSLKPGEEIGLETHRENDQFFRVESGSGMVVIDGNKYNVAEGVAILIPSGAQHNVINTSETDDLKLYTLYSPPHHKDGLMRSSREEADSNGAEFDGKTTE